MPPLLHLTRPPAPCPRSHTAHVCCVLPPDDVVRRFQGRTDVPTALVSAMIKHPTRATLQSYACSALGTLACSGECARAPHKPRARARPCPLCPLPAALQHRTAYVAHGHTTAVPTVLAFHIVRRQLTAATQ